MVIGHSPVRAGLTLALCGLQHPWYDLTFVASGKHNLNHSKYDSEYLKSAHILLLPATSHHVALSTLPRTTSDQYYLHHNRRATNIHSHHRRFAAEETQARIGLSILQLRDLTDQDQNITLLYH